MSVRIAVIDDERPARSELRHQLKELLPEAVIEDGESGAEALKLAGSGKYDLFFLDINLGDISGAALVQALKNMQPGMKIIFVTAYSEYAVTAFELGVEDYVLKPYDRKRLENVLQRCLPDTADKEDKLSARRIAISNEGKTVFVDVQDIAYIETYNRGSLFHVDGQDYYEGKCIGEFEKKLESRGFFRCHKSYLINLMLVKEIFPWGNNSLGLKMQGYEDTVLPVSREKTKVLRQRLGW